MRKNAPNLWIMIAGRVKPFAIGLIYDFAGQAFDLEERPTSSCKDHQSKSRKILNEFRVLRKISELKSCGN